MNETANYYTIETLPGTGNFLLPDDNAFLTEDKMRKLLKDTPAGKLTNSPCEYLMISEIENEENVKNSTPMKYENFGGHLWLVSNRFLEVLENFDVHDFSAHEAHIIHRATNGRWDRF